MGAPTVVGHNLVLGFSLSQGSSASFTLLQAPTVIGPWTTNAAAVLTTTAPAASFQFSLPVPASTEFYQVRSP
jgi:hypothetical protein